MRLRQPGLRHDPVQLALDLIRGRRVRQPQPVRDAEHMGVDGDGGFDSELVQHHAGRLAAHAREGLQRRAVPRAYFLFGVGAFAAYFAGFALILRHLRAMVRSLRRGDPFEPANVSRLKQVGLTLALVTGGSWIGQTLVSQLVRGAMKAPSLFDLVTPTFSILVVIVLSEVFREGSRLRRESELTI